MHFGVAACTCRVVLQCGPSKNICEKANHHTWVIVRAHYQSILFTHLISSDFAMGARLEQCARHTRLAREHKFNNTVDHTGMGTIGGEPRLLTHHF